MREKRFSGVYFDDRGLYTLSCFPGKRVYGERLVRLGKKEYRYWNSRRSKLAAYIQKGGSVFPFTKDSRVLYLGAASGTTVSHLSDIITRGQIMALEFSPRSFRDLVDVARDRKTIFPVLADARKPEEYMAIVGCANVLYQDVSQRDQVEIFIKNADRMLCDGGKGIMMMKARSIDSAANPKKLYQRAVEDLHRAGYKTEDLVELDPLQKDHAAIVVYKEKATGRG